jgi:Nucleotidyl transferase AbiEii toxin, Type IV TA system
VGREERVVIEHESILTDVQKRVLHAVGPFARRAGFYLAGGTAVALRFGHRRSEDFDWFAPALSRPDGLLSDLQAEGLSLQETQIEAGTVISRIEGVKISFFEYRYPLLDSLGQWPEYETDVASVRDLAAMKLLAVAQRGSRKDFIDMYELLQNGGVLRRMLEDFVEKFKADSVSALRGLTYFDDAEKEPMPEMLNTVEWLTMKRAVESSVREVMQ